MSSKLTGQAPKGQHMSNALKKKIKQHGEYVKADFSVYLPVDDPENDFNSLIKKFYEAMKQFSEEQKLLAVPVSGCIVPIKIKNMPDAVRDYIQPYDEEYGRVVEAMQNSEMKH
jgi:hypothetical protein